MSQTVRASANRIGLVVLLITAVAPRLYADEPGKSEAEEAPVYETDVEPILRANCFRCHDAKTKEAGLNLSTPRQLLRGGESGIVIRAGQPAASLLLEMIRDGEMPAEGEPLKAAEIETIRRWIAGGAKFRDPKVIAPVDTQHDILPILRLRCTACHGGRRREANLDLRTVAGLLKGGKSGPAVVSGKPGESLLVKRIQAGEMPPRRQLVSVSVKPMAEVELQRLAAWIRLGLTESDAGPDIATTQPDALVSDIEREFWSFQSLKPVAIPSVKAIDSVRNPIDSFIIEKLESSGLSLSPAADRLTLLRRVTFNLTGLPPTPEEIEQFQDDDEPGAYERLVDRLLASPRYGERWGRHWLDVAGYADSEGAQNEDRIRRHIYRYRDYVIRAFNADKPYDRFLHEQIAGDELADYENAKEMTEELYDNLVATGFLRTTPDRTFANITNFVPDRLEVIAEELQVFGSAVLGITINCARCHTHKFDPIPQRDYYRLAAIFKDGYDEHDWLKSQGPRTLMHVTTVERRAWEQHQRSIDTQTATLKKQLETEKDAAKKKSIEAQIKSLAGQKKPEPRIRALWSRGAPSPTYILKRGNYLTPGEPVGPGVPSVLTDGKTPFVVKPPWPGAKTTGRRLALARWLTEPGHPLTARVMVNRLWKHHFGAGIVRTTANFGTTGEEPTHPELLDWLAGEFQRRDWSIKSMHRLMVTSSTYRQSSRVTPQGQQADPDGQLLSRMPLRRLEAEAVRDSLLSVAGELDFSQYGPGDPVTIRKDGLVTVERTERGWRRSIYALQRRTQTPTLLENFDFPQMGPNCLERSEAIVAPQALHLMNNAMVRELAERFAERVWNGGDHDRPLQVDRVYAIALGRSPTKGERSLGVEMLGEFQRRWLDESKKTDAAPAGIKPAARRALTSYCHAILNSAAFLYVD
jgi:mono/diheme cytochrome c family protein